MAHPAYRCTYSNSITYAVPGKQYVAVVAANGGNYDRLFKPVMPGIKNPANRSGSVFVFAVPDNASSRCIADQ